MRIPLINVRVLLAVLGLLGSTGCSGDLTSIDTAGDDPTTTATSTPAAGTTGNNTGSPGPDSTGDDSPPDATEGDETGQTGGCDFDCGNGGYCDEDEDGAPICACDEGYAAYGLRCLPCTASDGTFDIDIPRVELSATFLLNGGSFPVGFYEQGFIALRDLATGDVIRLGDTIDGGTDAPVAVLPGNYEVHYSRLAGGTQVPSNRSAMLDIIRIPEGESYDIEVDVPAVELSGLFTMNGETPPEGQYENGAIVLRNPISGDEVELGETHDGSYQAIVVPGVYDLHYRRLLAQNQAPINHDARIGNTTVYEGGESQSLDIDVPVTTLSGALSLDSATPPKGNYEIGAIVLRDTLTGDEIEIGRTNDGVYSAPIVSGQYEVVYKRLVGGNEVPVNSAAVLEQANLEAIEQVLDIDIATAVVTGVITIGGVPAPADPGDDGLIVLRNPDTNDEAVLGNTANGPYSRRVVLGAYDVFYRQETSSGGVPVNTNARLQDVTIRGGAVLDVDVPMVTLNASVTVAGELPPESAYDDGLLYLRDPNTGDSVLLGNTRLATLTRPIIPGTYELHYVVEAAGPTMPVNAQSYLDTVEVGPSTDIEVDIPVVDFHGLVTINNEPPPMTFYDRAVLLLHDVVTKDIIYLGSIENGEIRRPLTAGTYVLAYRALVSNGLVPANTNAGLACIELSAP